MRLHDNAKNSMLDAVVIDKIQLHSGDPGSSGISNALGSLTDATFSAAASGARQLSADVSFTGLGASAAVLWFSIWGLTGMIETFRGAAEITTGDNVADGSGNYTLKATGTSISVGVAS